MKRWGVNLTLNHSAILTKDDWLQNLTLLEVRFMRDPLLHGLTYSNTFRSREAGISLWKRYSWRAHTSKKTSHWKSVKSMKILLFSSTKELTSTRWEVDSTVTQPLQACLRSSNIAWYTQDGKVTFASIILGGFYSPLLRGLYWLLIDPEPQISIVGTEYDDWVSFLRC